MSQAKVSTDATSDDKLWAALGYPIGLIAIIMLFIEEKKNRPFIRYHAIQSIALWVVYTVLAIIISFVTLGIGSICFGVLWLAFLYLAYLAYQGQMFTVPLVTDFLKNQHWI